jgi:hypothetical protein
MRSTFFALEFRRLHGLDRSFGKNFLTPERAALGAKIDLGRARTEKGSGRGETGEGFSPAENFHVLTVLNPSRNTAKAISEIGHRGVFHDT